MSIGTLLTHQGSLLLYSVTVFRCVSGSPFKGRATYPNRENKLWCTANGIRLSGPRLGRKSVTEKASESKQIYQDSCERVAIEGEFGVVKRRYGLDRIMCRLPDTSMTSIAMGFFAANMERKLRLLFAPLNEWSLDYDFDLGEFILFPVVDLSLIHI